LERTLNGGRDSRFHEHYSKEGPLYIILHKSSNTRWQFHFQSNQFMDERDHEIDLVEFSEDHRTVVNVLMKKQLIPSIGELYNFGGVMLDARGETASDELISTETDLIDLDQLNSFLGFEKDPYGIVSDIIDIVRIKGITNVVLAQMDDSIHSIRNLGDLIIGSEIVDESFPENIDFIELLPLEDVIKKLSSKNKEILAKLIIKEVDDPIRNVNDMINVLDKYNYRLYVWDLLQETINDLLMPMARKIWKEAIIKASDSINHSSSVLQFHKVDDEFLITVPLVHYVKNTSEIDYGWHGLLPQPKIDLSKIYNDIEYDQNKMNEIFTKNSDYY